MLDYAILGYLSWKPLAGYDLKKIFVESEILPWSGNNNQIYKTLVNLHKKGYVTKETIIQEDNPPRKVYSITDCGQDALNEWVMSDPDLPELRNIFLVQLSWVNDHKLPEILTLIEKYEDEIHMKYLSVKEKNKRGIIEPGRNDREKFIWAKIMDNRISFFENELNWILKFKTELVKKYGEV